MGEHTRTGFKPTPAVVRDWGTDDAEARVLRTPRDTVSFSRGWGDTGYRVEVVEYPCPECGFDHMVRRTDVSPERPNEARYWCLNPNCVHFVRDALSYACKGSYPQRDVTEPAVFEEAG